MAIKEDEFVDGDIRVEDAPATLHFKLAKLMGKRQARSGIRPNKSKLVIELLSTHPKLKSIKTDQ